MKTDRLFVIISSGDGIKNNMTYLTYKEISIFVQKTNTEEDFNSVEEQIKFIRDSEKLEIISQIVLEISNHKHSINEVRAKNIGKIFSYMKDPYLVIHAWEVIARTQDLDLVVKIYPYISHKVISCTAELNPADLNNVYQSKVMKNFTKKNSQK